MNAILKYTGAKWRLAPWIIKHLPKHESYLEPYFGSGAVFFNKEKARTETINDIDGEVVNFFRTCRESPEELAAALSLTPWAREERNNAFDPAGSENNVERARKFAVRCWMTFGASVNLTNGWRHTTGKYKDGGPDNPKLWRRMPDCVRDAAARLMDAQIENRPAIDVIRAHNGPEVLIYADPPYLHETRTAHSKAYNYEMNNTDHMELLQALNAHQGMVILSGYDSSIYHDALPGWITAVKNTTAERGVKRAECIWINPKAAEKIGKEE